MARTLTASDRSALIRLASAMPVGSDVRRAILAGLSKVSGASVDLRARAKAKSLETHDYQRRGGTYPKSGVPDSINFWADAFYTDDKTYADGRADMLRFSFKNTSERDALKWVQSFLRGKGINVTEWSTRQDGDYSDDWVAVTAYFNVVMDDL